MRERERVAGSILRLAGLRSMLFVVNTHSAETHKYVASTV